MTDATTIIHKPTLHHLNLKTTQLDAMIDWYALVIGTQVTHRFADGAWVTNDEANHRIALTAIPGTTDDPDKLIHSGMHHSAFEYPTMDGLLDTYVRLKGRSILPHACLDHGMTMSFYYTDPDGNSIELQYDHFDNWASSTQFMRSSPEFGTDPIGIGVDPDQLVAARDAGADRDEVHRRAYAGEFTPDDAQDLRLPPLPASGVTAPL